MLNAVLDTLIQGILLGALYGLFAAGLSLVFGIMRLVNIAHGDFIVLAAFMALLAQRVLHIQSPFTALIVLVPFMFIVGYVLQRLILNPTLGKDILRTILVTFGLSVIIENGLLEGFSADSQKLQGGQFAIQSIALPRGLAVGLFPLTMLVVCIVVIALLQWVMYQTKLGRTFRATSDDQMTAALMGVNWRNLYSIATGITMATVAIAGVFMGIRAGFDPSTGPDQLVFAFEAVIIGGLGSLWGTLVGGILLGVAQSIGARISAEDMLMAGHLMFLVVLMVRPNGLFPKRGD
jgi:branched-chain amino acid transport system permease protein